jgi:hypothetical protein
VEEESGDEEYGNGKTPGQRGMKKLRNSKEMKRTWSTTTLDYG